MAKSARKRSVELARVLTRLGVMGLVWWHAVEGRTWLDLVAIFVTGLAARDLLTDIGAMRRAEHVPDVDGSDIDKRE